jgi:hypothetical protein
MELLICSDQAQQRGTPKYVCVNCVEMNDLSTTNGYQWLPSQQIRNNVACSHAIDSQSTHRV